MSDGTRETSARSGNRSHCRLSAAVVQEMRRRALTESFGALARAYGVTPETVRSAVYGWTWAHLTDPAPLRAGSLPARRNRPPAPPPKRCPQCGVEIRPLSQTCRQHSPHGAGRVVIRDAISAEALRTLLASFSERLTPNQRRALELRYGLLGAPPQSLARVGRDLGLTKERVRQLTKRGLAELRRRAHQARAAGPDRAAAG